MQAKVGDRISCDAKKVGQPRRGGVVTAVGHGLSGVRLTVAWDDGTTTTFAPGAGVLLVEGKAKKAPKKAPTAAKAVKAKAKVRSSKPKKVAKKAAKKAGKGKRR